MTSPSNLRFRVIKTAERPDEVMGTLCTTESLHARVLAWLDRPRTRISVKPKTIKNRKADLGTFRKVLERYTAKQLEDEQAYVNFLHDLEAFFAETTLKETTLSNKVTCLLYTSPSPRDRG